MEIVALRDGSFVLLDKDNCEWVFGFAIGDEVLVTYFDYDTKSMVEKLMKILSVATVDGKVLIIGKHESNYYAVHDAMISNIEGAYVC